MERHRAVALGIMAAAAVSHVCAPVFADARGSVIEGNAVDCSDAEGEDLTGSPVVQESLSSDRRTLDVWVQDDAYEITAVGVKGGPKYMLYTSAPFTGLTAPVTGNGEPAAIGHWFVCGRPAASSPSPSPSETATQTPSPVQTPTGTPAVSAAPVPTAVAGGGRATDSDDRPGLSLAFAGATLAVIGVSLLITRRVRGHGD